MLESCVDILVHEFAHNNYLSQWPFSGDICTRDLDEYQQHSTSIYRLKQCKASRVLVFHVPAKQVNYRMESWPPEVPSFTPSSGTISHILVIDPHHSSLALSRILGTSRTIFRLRT